MYSLKKYKQLNQMTLQEIIEFGTQIVVYSAANNLYDYGRASSALAAVNDDIFLEAPYCIISGVITKIMCDADEDYHKTPNNLTKFLIFLKYNIVSNILGSMLKHNVIFYLKK